MVLEAKILIVLHESDRAGATISRLILIHMASWGRSSVATQTGNTAHLIKTVTKGGKKCDWPALTVMTEVLSNHLSKHSP